MAAKGLLVDIENARGNDKKRHKETTHSIKIKSLYPAGFTCKILDIYQQMISYTKNEKLNNIFRLRT